MVIAMPKPPRGLDSSVLEKPAVAKRKEPLSVTHPDLAAQWHPTKNADLTPNDVTHGTNTRIWWKCPKGPDHEWQATVERRTTGSGCPFCNSDKVSVTNSLAALFPQVAAQWHPTKNGNLTPDEVIAGTNKKAWWQCPNGPDHEWQAVVGSRTFLKAGCPFCAGRRASVTNSLAALHPEIATQWHPTKNGALTPHDVAGGRTKVWWKCPNGPDHEWQISVGDRTAGKGCPFCAGYAVSITNSLAALYPEVAAQWHPTKNGDLTPAQVTAGTKGKFWWKCASAPDHEWQATVANRTCNESTTCKKAEA